MTIEELKQRLEGIRWIDKEISQLYLELQYLETGLFKQTTLTQSRVQTSRANSSESQLVAQLASKEDITNRIDRLTKERLELIRMIDALRNPKHRLALRLYYIQQKVDIEAGEIMNVSKTTFFRYLKLALTELADLITHEEREKQP
ncbi:DUF1492 domain-containing protein [Streptococcus suis]|uniref:DUF1492 domain-containing protein n=1 Tax=Streptococcus suis TaxID=1307 RepID=UPI00192DC34B|nr:DUF1492 domain-containing protein [Streptococcus suis]MBL6504882.1 DUF1492 domain-containing protein [Streptococcus suis]MBM0242737.1 DUF1492 domain-containing protein [Streptococcus suis]MBM7205653.1 DUF1492 domain-containing protein [Streptococcus suis]MBM7282975.1 DUF1492 domain-containing protein [Streptococcus suis]MBO4136475.1 DUF1492 domain-containing protein [Streptococcus suis]